MIELRSRWMLERIKPRWMDEIRHRNAIDLDWSWLRACVVHLDRRAQDVADRSLPPLLASDVLLRGMKELRRLAQASPSWRKPIAYRNWLMVVTLAALPVRLRNFAALSLRHMDHRAGI